MINRCERIFNNWTCSAAAWFPTEQKKIKIQFKVIYNMQQYPIDLLFFQSGSLLGLWQKVVYNRPEDLMSENMQIL